MFVDLIAEFGLIFAFMIYKHFASPNLRRLRKERKLPLDVVARHAGIDFGALSRKERQLVRLSDIEILKLAAFFGVEPRELRKEEDDPAAQAIQP